MEENGGPYFSETQEIPKFNFGITINKDLYEIKI